MDPFFITESENTKLQATMMRRFTLGHFMNKLVTADCQATVIN